MITKPMSPRLFGAAGTLALLVSGAASASADVRRHESKLHDLQAQMGEIHRQLDEANISWNGAPAISSKDGRWRFKVRGRVQADAASIDQDRPVTTRRDINGVELRRARLGVEGHVFYDWQYKFEIDLAGGDATIKDAYVAYAPKWFPDRIKKSELLIGNFYVHNSLEQVTSSRFITFLERAAFTNAFTLDRQFGVGLLLGGDHWSFQTGYYGSSSDAQQTWFDASTALAVRGTVAPIKTDRYVVHLGASYRNRNAGLKRKNHVAELFRYRERGADLHLADRFINTDRIADSDDMFVLEAAFVAGPFSIQGEYAQLKADLPYHVAPVSPIYRGWYVDASLFLTGEQRRYSAGSGAFERVKVLRPLQLRGENRGYGAWQIAGRYDGLDLTDKADAIAQGGFEDCNLCGKQKTWLLGLNWWTTDYTAIKLQYSVSKIEGGANDGAKIRGIGLRAQIDW